MSDKNTNTELIIEFLSKKSLPRYEEIPNVGLYLDQVVKYINDVLEPLHLNITPSMLSNYVKKGYIDSPVKKQYYAEQIAYLMFIVVAKQVLSMEHIAALLELQKATYSTAEAYNYFCEELEHMLKITFEKINDPEAVSEIGSSKEFPYEKNVLRSVVIAVSHIIYLNYCFERSLHP